VVVAAGGMTSHGESRPYHTDALYVFGLSCNLVYILFSHLFWMSGLHSVLDSIFFCSAMHLD
jgi:hypothetical protein